MVNQGSGWEGWNEWKGRVDWAEGNGLQVGPSRSHTGRRLQVAWSGNTLHASLPSSGVVANRKEGKEQDGIKILVELQITLQGTS